MWGLGFGGLGFGVWGLKFGVWGLPRSIAAAERVYGAPCLLLPDFGFGFGVDGFGFRVLGFRFCV